ncbi:LamG-like jellyroll fold domain-containing protein [Victivallis sp. Marseille-Q1083]|uniref:LamG-like jellyroll fold domain-containing protein n=1 Tax=Victivallis sp. Marseille-Q1083 TaxID=2717288 RepID=UPI0015886D72|nr:LamG-like jellyroll fold domain-containing protein [Victivallis sp. Marseille-Q1083]
MISIRKLLSFAGLLFLSLNAVTGLDYHRDLQYSYYEPPPRERAGGKTYFYAQWEPYDLFHNYMGYWIDRPLLTNVAWRDLYEPNRQETNYLGEVEILKRYEIDGFASLDYLDAYQQKLEWEQKHQLGLTHLLVLPTYLYPDNYESLREYVRSAVKAPQSPRINGKVVIFHYSETEWEPEVLKEMIDRLKQEPDIGDSFLLFGDMPFLEFHGKFAEYAAMGQAPAEDFLERYRRAVRAKLDATDGLALYIRDIGTLPHEKIWAATVLPWYRQYMLPIILEELEKPEYKGKLLGAYLRHGYINHLSGNNVAEHGTRQLRLHFDEALRANPDFLIFFEWNEANENTSIQPTVANSFTHARLIRYYANRLNGKELTPMPGDDTSIPNLVLSSRQRARLGELIHYEILNIPDGAPAATLQVQLILKDIDGRVLQEFPPEAFETDKLMAVSYRVATEELADQFAVVPELKVTDADGNSHLYDSFDYTELCGTANWRYKETHQPLRDLFVPQSSKLSVRRNPDGTYTIDAALAASEKLKAVEVMNCHEEAAAADPSDEFDSEKYAVILGAFTAMGLPDTPRPIGVFSMSHAGNWAVRSDGLIHGVCLPYDETPEGGMKMFTIFLNMRSTFVLKVPRQHVEEAVLEMDYPDGIGKHQFRIRDILAQGKLAKLLTRNIRLDLERLDRLADYPLLEQPEGRIHTVMHSPNHFPIFQLRAITDSGKIYRSKPTMPFRPDANGKTETLPVFSEYRGKVVPIAIRSVRIPELNYQFLPACGAMLPSGYEPFYDAQLGGGFTYLEPMWRGPLPFLPQDYQSFAPGWQEEDGVPYLSFDGVSNYVNLPREALPSGAATLEFEIRTPGGREQVLFRCFAHDFAGNLQLVMSEDDELIASYAQGTGDRQFQTGLKIPRDRWTKIKVDYDYRTLTFSVGDETRSYPFFSRGYVPKPAAFGGTNVPKGPVGENTKYFKGDLRKLYIRHNSARASQTN